MFSFAGIATGQPLVQNIRLKGTGVLDTPSGNTEPFTLQIKSNSSSGSYCEATISPVIPKMNIVTLANESYYGYNPYYTQYGTGIVLNSVNNFGPNDNSIVKLESFNYINEGDYLTLNLSPNKEAYKWITGTTPNGQIADIVYIALPGNFNEGTMNLLVDYMDKGGVLIVFSEIDEASQRLLRRVFNTTSLTVSRSHAGGAIYPFVTHDYYNTTGTAEAKEELMRKYEGDPLLNGPFGDIRDKQYGEDFSSTSTIFGYPVNDPSLTVYAYNNDITQRNPAASKLGATFIKYESARRNLIWTGDSGFTSSNNGNPNSSDVILCPFSWNPVTKFPVAKPRYGRLNAGTYPVYNSTMLCNVMAWAINRANELKALK